MVPRDPSRNETTMAKFSLLPRNRGFFTLFDQAGANLVAISETLHEMLVGYPATRGLAGRIKELELAGDDITHRIVRLLNSTFVTPIDREDIYALTSRLDDICDYIDEAADEVVLYGVRTILPPALAQADVIRRACANLAVALERLDGMRDVSETLVEVHTLENEGDRLVRDAIAGLFSGGQDALLVIRWKDIYEQLEEAIDSCEQAAHVLESAYLKNA
jgi:uncharacterized protein Yka (UPF0111/DUF47 family)